MPLTPEQAVELAEKAAAISHKLGTVLGDELDALDGDLAEKLTAGCLALAELVAQFAGVAVDQSGQFAAFDASIERVQNGIPLYAAQYRVVALLALVTPGDAL